MVLSLFMLMGALAALAAVITTARLGSGTHSIGQMAELYVIAAAVIGGTSFAGGVGTIPGAIAGAVLIQSLDNRSVAGRREVAMTHSVAEELPDELSLSVLPGLFDIGLHGHCLRRRVADDFVDEERPGRITRVTTAALDVRDSSGIG